MWPKVPLKSVSTLGPQYGAGLRAVASTPGGVRYVRITDIDDFGHLRPDSIVGPDEGSVDEYVLEEGDLLFARSGATVGKAYRYTTEDGPCVFAGYLIRFRPDSRVVIPSYLAYYLQCAEYWAWVQSKKRVAAQPNINGAEYSALELPLPTIREQQRIVELLDAADHLRQLRRQADAKASRILPALFLKTFGDPATNPRTWPVSSIRSLASKYSDGPFGSNLKSDHYVPRGVRVIRLQNIGVGEFDDRDQAFISKEHFGTLSKHECRPGDVLIGTLGDPNLRACIQPQSIDVALNKADCVQLRVDDQLATNDYVCWLLNMPGTLSLAQAKILGQTRARISMGRLGELLVPRPPLELQQSFSERARAIQATLGTARGAARKVDDLFDALLARAFSGHLTAKWRESRMKELLVEMEQQARLLNLTLPLEATT